MDVHTPEQRRFNMSRIKGAGTRPERLVADWFLAEGFQVRCNDPDLPGRPDIVLPDVHTVLFMHGCFWHGHEDCRYFKLPATRTQFWRDKIAGTMVRDQKKTSELRTLGWEVLVVWECELKPKVRQETLARLTQTILEGAE